MSGCLQQRLTSHPSKQVYSDTSSQALFNRNQPFLYKEACKITSKFNDEILHRTISITLKISKYLGTLIPSIIINPQ